MKFAWRWNIILKGHVLELKNDQWALVWENDYDNWIARDNHALETDEYIKGGFADADSAMKWVVNKIKDRLNKQIVALETL